MVGISVLKTRTYKYHTALVTTVNLRMVLYSFLKQGNKLRNCIEQAEVFTDGTLRQRNVGHVALLEKFVSYSGSQKIVR